MTKGDWTQHKNIFGSEQLYFSSIPSYQTVERRQYCVIKNSMEQLFGNVLGKFCTKIYLHLFPGMKYDNSDMRDKNMHGKLNEHTAE